MIRVRYIDLTMGSDTAGLAPLAMAVFAAAWLITGTRAWPRWRAAAFASGEVTSLVGIARRIFMVSSRVLHADSLH